MSWLKKIFGQKADKVKSFEEETADLTIEEFRKVGKAPIEVDKIVGSVGRAHELDQDFRYRGRAITGRYHSIEDALREGRPMEPVKVLKVKRNRRASEYYVVDGHHRVAQAKKHGYEEINADITEVVIPDNDEEANG